ncbi:MAG TPA: DUF429 domain-containing protein [Capillimicrobium sp.]|jgi:predicted RNase H-like nuclease
MTATGAVPTASREKPAAPLIAIGADGARGGWAAACLYADAPRREDATVWETRLELFPGIEALAAHRQAEGGTAAVAIDVPIGLPDTVEHRACDKEAIGRLKGRAKSVFMPPARRLLAAGREWDALVALVEHERQSNPSARGLSRQAAGLIPKIAEVDTWARAHPDSEHWLWECHPELSFLALNDGSPLAHDKRSAAGVMKRLKLIAAEFDDAHDQLAEAQWPGSRADLTDLVDAYAALSTAVVCARGHQEELGDGRRDAEGLPMRMAL